MLGLSFVGFFFSAGTNCFDFSKHARGWKDLQHIRGYVELNPTKTPTATSAEWRCMADATLTPERDWETNVKKSWRHPPKNLFWNNSHLRDKCGIFVKQPQWNLGGTFRGTLWQRKTDLSQRTRESPKQFCPEPLLWLKTPKLLLLGKKHQNSQGSATKTMWINNLTKHHPFSPGASVFSQGAQMIPKMAPRPSLLLLPLLPPPPGCPAKWHNDEEKKTTMLFPSKPGWDGSIVVHLSGQ